MNQTQKLILDLINDEKWHEVLAAIEQLDTVDQQHGRMLMAKGDALYELGQDIEALKSYLGYLKLYPEGRSVDFAIFNIAICLKNLNLDEEAYLFLSRLPPEREDQEKEMKHSHNLINAKAEARALIEGFIPKDSS